MKRHKTAGIKDLKNNLSSYLRDVRNGARVFVTDRNNIVAELHEPYTRSLSGGAMHPLLVEWTEVGLVSLPSIEKVPLPISPVRLRAGTSFALLDKDREEPER